MKYWNKIKYTNDKTTFVFCAAFREYNFTNASKVLNSGKDKTRQECVMSAWGATWKKCTDSEMISCLAMFL